MKRLQGHGGFTLLELMIVVAIIAIIAAIAIPGLQRARISAHERNASASLKSVVTAQENFKQNDLDRNGVGDYWTVNLAGLYCLQTLGTGGAIASINDIALASADLDSANATAAAYATSDVSYNAALLLPASPKAGYVYQTLINDVLGNPYAYDTDMSGSAVHSHTTFGVMAVPQAWESTGTYVYIVGDNASVFRRDFGTATVAPAFGAPMATFDGSTPCDFPTGPVLSTSWGTVE